MYRNQIFFQVYLKYRLLRISFVFNRSDIFRPVLTPPTKNRHESFRTQYVLCTNVIVQHCHCYRTTLLEIYFRACRAAYRALGRKADQCII